jgi:hypothetical protein
MDGKIIEIVVHMDGKNRRNLSTYGWGQSIEIVVWFLYKKHLEKKENNFRFRRPL